jgi:hypothetical protein
MLFFERVGKVCRSEKTEEHSFTTLLPFVSTKDTALWTWLIEVCDGASVNIRLRTGLLPSGLFGVGFQTCELI